MDEGLSPRGLEPRRPPTEQAGGSRSDRTIDTTHQGLVMQVLSTEHFSLLSQRSLVYNEAFTRVGMLLTFVSMSLVALALLSGALPTSSDLTAIASIVLGFDLVVGLATVIRVRNAYQEDFIAVQAMNRVRRGYAELAPEAMPYISMGTYDDLASVVVSYGASIAPSSVVAGLSYGLSTSIGLAMLVVALLAGAFVAVVGLAIGVSGLAALAAGAAATLVTIGALAWLGYRAQIRNQANAVVRFPQPRSEGPARPG
jgi:hypothetical protein